MTPSEKVASRYADIFVSLFERIGTDSSVPLVAAGCFPQQNVDGVPFKGSNAMLASMVSAARGYGLPVWLTMRRKDELGLLVLPGEHSIPVVHYDIYYEDVTIGKRDPQMNDAVYASLPDEDKGNWVKRCYMNAYPEFNICQTNFRDVYPEQWSQLEAHFGAADRVAMQNGLLDGIVGSESVWYCPVVVESGRRVFAYDEAYDVIKAPEKSVYADEGRYYGDLLYTLARSTGSEGRMDRDISSEDLKVAAREELVSELAGATLATIAGVQATIQGHNLSCLKSWVNAIRENPNVIYRAVNDASKAADMVSVRVGLEARPGFDVQKMMDGVETAQQAREKAQQIREQRAKAAAKGHRKGWKPVKAGSQPNMKVKR